MEIDNQCLRCEYLLAGRCAGKADGCAALAYRQLTDDELFGEPGDDSTQRTQRTQRTVEHEKRPGRVPPARPGPATGRVPPSAALAPFFSGPNRR